MTNPNNKKSHIIVVGNGGGGSGTQVQADWNEADSTQPDYIKNKPTIPTVNDATVTFTQGGVTKGSVTLNQSSDATIALDAGGGTQVNADWNESDPTDPSYIENKPSLATVATTGNYSDLNSTPTIPTNTSDLTNDSGFITISDVPAQVQANWNESDSSSAAYIQNKPTIPAAPMQSDWNEADSGSLAYIANKPTIPAAQVNSDWNANSGVAQILNKPSMSTEALTFTLSDQSTVTLTVYVQPTI